MNHAKLLSEAFSALEKQAIRELARSMPPYYSESKAIFSLLTALDERDREVERLQEQVRIEQNCYHMLNADHAYLIEEYEELRNEINSHAPEGRNYTNGQYVSLLLENQRLRKEITDLMSEMHEQLDYERWAESKGYGYDEYFKAVDNGEWDMVGDQALAGEDK